MKAKTWLLIAVVIAALISVAFVGCGADATSTSTPDASAADASVAVDAGGSTTPDTGSPVDAQITDAGAADASDADTTVYSDMTSATFWSAFDTKGLGTGTFEGAAFDGRYVYFVPSINSVGGVVARYDTQASFGSAGSWTTFDTTTVNAGAKGFVGGVFDGRYVYFIPTTNGAPDGIVARYDTQASFSDGASWSTFDTTTVDATAKGFYGGTFDGRYLYLVPGTNGAVARYDTQGASFNDGGASWTTFDTTTLDGGAAKGFAGAAFDGQYVYFVPIFNGAFDGIVTRYDTKASFAAGASWTTFDTTTVNANAKAFAGAAFDGRYLYLVPDNNGGTVARYDTQAAFATAASWSTFDTTTLGPDAGARGFIGAAFDGRYVYLVPFFNGAADGVVARHDTKGTFTAAASWSTFDTTTVDSGAKGFAGAAFDGRYVYFVPYAGTAVARFDAKTPPSMPKLPAFHGSFL
jgi:hypothetical protein